MSKPLAGVYVALTTPFEGDGIATAKLKENVARLNRTSLAGYLVLGSTGESVSLTGPRASSAARRTAACARSPSPRRGASPS